MAPLSIEAKMSKKFNFAQITWLDWQIYRWPLFLFTFPTIWQIYNIDLAKMRIWFENINATRNLGRLQIPPNCTVNFVYPRPKRYWVFTCYKRLVSMLWCTGSSAASSLGLEWRNLSGFILWANDGPLTFKCYSKSDWSLYDLVIICNVTRQKSPNVLKLP